MKAKKITYILISLIMLIVLFSCATIPKNATAVKSFEKEKYLGK